MAKWATLHIANNNERLLICSCGVTGVATPELRVCPKCRQVPDVQLVECANPYHNEPEGCQNPECWKFRKDR